MSEILAKLSKAVDAFTDVLTEDIDSTNNLERYKYDDFIEFCKTNRRKNSIVAKGTISVTKVTEFNGFRYPEAKFLIRIVLLDKCDRPIFINTRKDEILGTIIIANSIDTKLADFMGEKTKKTVVWKEEK